MDVQGSDVTVLITDMEGSTAFTDARGDHAAVELIRVHERIVRDAIANHGAREIKSMGDGFMIAFPSPTAGIACALDILESLREHNLAHIDQPIHVRMGMNTGPAIEEGGDLYGTTVNAASRIAAKARSGQLLVPEDVVARGSGDWQFVDRGLFWLKGLREQWRLYEATRVSVPVYHPAISEGRTPFVDRESERARLRLHLDNALEGRGGVVLLAGDPGAGKSRLADEMGAEAQGRGMHHFVGRCYEMGRTQPYTPLIEVLEAADRRLEPRVFRAALGEVAGEIARLLPQIRRRYADVPPAAELPPQEGRRYLHTSARDVLAAIAAVRPLCIVWDDLHWADDSSLAFIEHVAEALRELPILLIGTYTHTELTPARPLRAVLESLHRRRLVETFEVGTLREEDVDVLLTSIAGTPPPPALVKRLYAETEGNVFFFEEVVRHLAERGRLFDDAGTWREDVEHLDVEVPETLRLTIMRRLEHLSEDARSVLSRAGLIGRGFGFDLIEAVADLGEDALLDALDEAERARLVTSTVEPGVVQFRFAHELIRQTLVGEVTAARRQRIHQRIADAMEVLYATSLVEHAADLASQLQRGGDRDPERSARLAALAGDRAMEAAAFEDAYRYFERALVLLADAPDAVRAPILEKLGTASRSLGRPDEAIEGWWTALDAYESAGDAHAVARLCLDAAVQVTWWMRHRDTMRFVERGESALDDQHHALSAGFRSLRGIIASQRGAYEEATTHLDEALALARAHPDDKILGRVLYSKTVHHWDYLEHKRAIEYGLQSIEYLRRSGDFWNMANVQGFVGQSLGFTGLFEDAAEVTEGTKDLAQRIGNWVAYVYADRARAWRHLSPALDPDHLEADGRRDLELGRKLGYDWMRQVGYTRMGFALFVRGRWEEALALAEESAGLERGVGLGHLGRLVLLHAYLGNRDDAMAAFERLRDRFPLSDEHNRFGAWDSFLAALEGLTLIGEHDEVARHVDLAIDASHGDRLFRGWDYRMHDTVAGLALFCAGRWDEAEAHIQRAIKLADDLPYLIEQPEGRRFYAWMLMQRDAAGDRERARDLLDAAVPVYRRIGMPRHEALAASMRAQIA